MDEEENPVQLELPSAAPEDAQQLKRENLLRAVNSCQLNTLEERIAWLLNNYPKTRDSDIALQLRYWRQFQEERFGGGEFSVSDYYHLTKLTSIARARATIQNKLKLFQASDEIKKRRKQLSENERDSASRSRPNRHLFSVYIDESGKTQDNLVVGSMWYLNSLETLKIYQLVTNWKESNKMEEELHFKSITEAKLPHYCALADLIVSRLAMVSFKAVSVQRRGIANVQDALMNLTSHLLVQGIEHENGTGRAKLPREIHLIKDAEEIGQDKIFAANLSDRMKQSAVSHFQDQLHVGEFSAENSSENIHLQITDLYTSSIGRQVNTGLEGTHAKDRFAAYFLGKLGHRNMEQSETIADMAVHIIL